MADAQSAVLRSSAIATDRLNTALASDRLDRTGTVNDWKVNDWKVPTPTVSAPTVCSKTAPLSPSADVDPIDPPTATGRQLLKFDMPGRFSFWSYSFFRKGVWAKFGVSYARPQDHQGWRFAADEATRWNRHFDSISNIFSFLSATGFVSTLFAVFLAPWWVFFSCLLASCVSLTICEAQSRALILFREMAEGLQSALPVQFAARVSEKISRNDGLARQWEGILRHAEQTSVPVLIRDVEHLLAAPDVRPTPVSATPWRVG